MGTARCSIRETQPGQFSAGHGCPSRWLAVDATLARPGLPFARQPPRLTMCWAFAYCSTAVWGTGAGHCVHVLSALSVSTGALPANLVVGRVCQEACAQSRSCSGYDRPGSEASGFVFGCVGG